MLNRQQDQGPAASFHTNGAAVHALVACLQLALLVLLYGQTQSFDYVYYDDAEYVLENSAVLSGLSFDGLRWAFTSGYMSNWHPLTWLSHMLDISLFGTDPGWAHIHNVVIHGINSLLVYVILLRLSQSWGKACTLSLIFLIHPLHVESVAWIAERKDLLCALFFFLGLIIYDNYRAHAGRWRYAGVLLAFILSLLAKPMAVTFPVVLLILDYFIYRQVFGDKRDHNGSMGTVYARAFVEKLPFIVLAAASCVVTILVQDAGNAVAYLEGHSVGSRLMTAATAYGIYIKQAVMPVNLVAFYPLNDFSSVSASALLLPGTFLGAALLLSLLYRVRYPLLGAGICWYLVTLLPVIGLVQVGSQAHADRYMYLPSVGLLIAGVYLLPSAGSRYFQLGRILTAVFLAYLTLICYWQVGYWRNQHVLFSRVLHVVGPNFQAHLHLAKDYIDRGMLTEAREHALATIEQRPDVSDGYQAMGNIALAKRKFAEAEAYYRLALAKGPALAEVVNNLGITLTQQGNIPAGLAAFEKALQINPALKEAQTNLQLYQPRRIQESQQ